jgi:hypothetical protein
MQLLERCWGKILGRVFSGASEKILALQGVHTIKVGQVIAAATAACIRRLFLLINVLSAFFQPDLSALNDVALERVQVVELLIEFLL